MEFDVHDWKTWMGLLPCVVGVCNLVYYLYSVYYGRVRPHIVSWVIWGLTSGIAAAAQVVKGAGPGAWMSVAGSLFCFTRAVVSITHGEKSVTRSDWVCFASCLAAIAWWLMTDDPLLSVIIVSAIDLAALYPTARKSWDKPYEENLFSYVLFGLVYLPSIAAMQVYSFVNLVYPVVSVLASVFFVPYLMWRRRIVSGLVTNSGIQ